MTDESHAIASQARIVEGCSGTPGGGRYMAIRLLIEGSTIIEASYRCNGCTYAHQLGRGVSHFLRGRTVTQARLLDKDDVLSIAGPVPEGKDVYAAMLAEALQDALNAHDQLNHSEP